MNGTRELETGRLLLRRYRMDDAALLHQYFGIDEKMYEYSGWNPYATPEMAEGSVREFIESYEKFRGKSLENSPEETPFYGWAIELKKDSGNVFAGTVGAYDYDSEAGTAEIGISVRRDLWGQGIAGEALKAVVEYLTREEKIPCIKAWCAAPNIGSKKAMEKAGMHPASTEPKALKVGDKVFDKLNYEYRVSDSTDLTFRMKQGIFNYRVGAIIIHDGKLLLMHNEEEPYYYTVGGRVHFNETTEETVVREVREEIGVDLEIDRFLFFQEQFFDGKVTGTHIHELGVYYLMKDSPALENLECHSVTARGVAEELHWIPLEETGSLYIVPESIAARLGSLPQHAEHIIEIDER